MLSEVKWIRGKSHEELKRSNLWKYLFRWSDWLDQKHALKINKNLHCNPLTELSLNKYALSILGREISDLAATT